MPLILCHSILFCIPEVLIHSFNKGIMCKQYIRQSSRDQSYIGYERIRPQGPALMLLRETDKQENEEIK